MFGMSPTQEFLAVMIVSGLLAWIAADSLLKAAGYGRRPTMRPPDPPSALENDYENSIFVKPYKHCAAQQERPADGACTCGHKWTAHNENGCCWDDDCGCTQPRPETP